MPQRELLGLLDATLASDEQRDTMPIVTVTDGPEVVVRFKDAPAPEYVVPAGSGVRLVEPKRLSSRRVAIAVAIASVTSFALGFAATQLIG